MFTRDLGNYRPSFDLLQPILPTVHPFPSLAFITSIHCSPSSWDRLYTCLRTEYGRCDRPPEEIEDEIHKASDPGTISDGSDRGRIVELGRQSIEAGVAEVDRPWGFGGRLRARGRKNGSVTSLGPKRAIGLGCMERTIVGVEEGIVYSRYRKCRVSVYTTRYNGLANFEARLRDPHLPLCRQFEKA